MQTSRNIQASRSTISTFLLLFPQLSSFLEMYFNMCVRALAFFAGYFKIDESGKTNQNVSNHYIMSCKNS